MEFDQESAKSFAQSQAGDWAGKVADKNDITGWQKKLIVAGASGGTGLLIDLGLQLLSSYIGGGDTSPLDAIVEKLAEIDARLAKLESEIGNMGFTLEQMERGPINDAVSAVRNATGDLRKDLAWPGTNVDSAFSTLRQRLDALRATMATSVDALLQQDGDGMWWSSFEAKYPPLGDGTRWDSHAFISGDWTAWGLRSYPDPVYATGPAGQAPDVLTGQRLDHRGMLGPMIRGTVALMEAHVLLDPALQINGQDRDLFARLSVALRVLALRMLGSVKIARPVDFSAHPTLVNSGTGESITTPGDYGHVVFGCWGKYNPSGNFLGWPYILDHGWPAGAVDTVTGANIMTSHWLPKDHGYPGLYGLDPSTPPNPFTASSIEAAGNASVEFSRKAWSAVALTTGAFELFDLADGCDVLAHPPATNNTLRVERVGHMHRREAAGTRMLQPSFTLISALDDACREPQMVDVTHVDQRLEIELGVQPDKYRFTDSTPTNDRAQKIVYRFFLEATQPGPSGLSSEPLPMVSPTDVERIELDASASSGTVTLKCRGFTFLNAFGRQQPVGGGWSPALRNHSPAYAGRVVRSLRIGNQRLSKTPGAYWDAWTIGTGVDPEGARLSPGDPVDLVLRWTRTLTDGRVTFTFEHDGGPVNAMVWLVIEEPVGGAVPDEWKRDVFGNKIYPPPLPTKLRTGELLVFVGEEMTAPPGYLQRLTKCAESWEKLMEPIIARELTAASPRELPFPDPTIDVSVRGYAERLNRLIRTP